MRFQAIMFWLMGCSALIGGLDRVAGNHLRLGERFDEGFRSLGALGLGMVGMLCLAPVLAGLLRPILSPLLAMLHVDPAFIGALIANDMGGYSLAMELSHSPEAGHFFGALVASMLGATLVFTIPVGLSILEEQDKRHFARGLVIGLIAIPIGCLTGGFLAGFRAQIVLLNTLPALLFSAMLALGLTLAPRITISGALCLGKGVTFLAYIGLAFAAFEYMTRRALIPGMLDIMEAMEVVAACGVVLLGTFPFLSLLTRLLKRPLAFLGRSAGLNDESVAGLIYSLANSVPVYSMMKNMGPKGIILNTAWLVPITAVLGDHLAFTASKCPKMLLPVIVGKASAGIFALCLALYLCRKMD